MTERDHRALVRGGMIVASAVLLLRVLPWGVRRVLGAEGVLRERAALLDRARATLVAGATLRGSAATVGRALVALAPRLLSGGTVAEAGADLSARVNLAAARHRALLERVDQVADSATAGRLRRVGVHATLETDIRGVVGVLRALAFDEAALSVREVRVVAGDPGAGDQGPEVLRLEVTVAGWFLVKEPT